MLKSILFAAATVVLSTFALPQTAQATPIITQDFLFEDGSSFGSVSIDLSKIDEEGYLLEWESFELFGYTITENVLFNLDFDAENLFAGFNFMLFDVTDSFGLFAFQGFFDTDFGYLEILTLDGDFVRDLNFSLSTASVNVPEPGTMFLLLASVGGLLLRRRV